MREFSEQALEQHPFSKLSLPTGWLRVSLADMGSEVSPGFASGAHTSDGTGIAHLRPMNVDRDGKTNLDVVKSVASTGGVELVPGDILFNNTNSPELVGKTAVVGRREEGFAFSNHMTRIRLPSGAAPTYFGHQLHFLWTTGYMKYRCTNHVNQASISSKTLADTVPVLLPPSGEQTRIVDKLEELLSDLDAGVAELKAALKKLAQYRQLLLNAAVEGRLTKAWRAQHGKPEESGAQMLAHILRERHARWEAKQLAKFEAQGKSAPNGWQAKYVEPASLDTKGLSELPHGWVWVTLDMLIDDGPQNGLYLPRDRYGRGCPILRIDDFQNDWARPREELNRIDANGATLATYSLREGDLVINRVNSMTHLGKTLVIDDSLDGAVFESNMMRFNLSPGANPLYVGGYLGSELGRKRLTQDAKWAVNQASINQQDVKRTPVPMAPIEEQTAIVEVVRDALSRSDDQLQAINKALRQSAAQRKNILRAAFSGQLVPQDPNDEPASALLERIRAERAAQVGTKKPRGRRPSAKEAA